LAFARAHMRRVIDVLPAPRRVASDRLQASARRRADGDIAPCRRQAQRADAGQVVARGPSPVARIDVAEPTAWRTLAQNAGALQAIDVRHETRSALRDGLSALPFSTRNVERGARNRSSAQRSRDLLEILDEALLLARARFVIRGPQQRGRMYR